jgi:hypothetical protein
MNKNPLKFIIDLMLFVDILSISIIGLILAFIIPRGGQKQSGSLFLGLARHDWGDIHLYLSLILLFLIVLHITLNWSWVVHMTKKYFEKNWILVLSALPIISIILLLICNLISR